MGRLSSVVFTVASNHPYQAPWNNHRRRERRGKPWEVTRHTLARPQDCPSTHLHLLPFYDTEIGLWQMAINGTARKTSDRRLLPLSSNLLALSRRETPRPRATDLCLFKVLRSHLKPMLRWKKKSKLRQCSKKQLKDH